MTEEDLQPFFYPLEQEIAMTGVRGIYLNNYIRWDSKAQHEEMLDLYGYETAKQLRTFDTYNDVDCQHYSGLHDEIKFRKWGYGKVLDHAVREIRLRRMTRGDAIAAVNKYQDIDSLDRKRFLGWIEIDDGTFDACIDRFRDPRIWVREASGQWVLTDSLANHANDLGIKAVALEKTEDCQFRVTPNKDPEADESEYKLLAKGMV